MTGSGPSSVLLAGGGTAGHVSPLLALADCLRRRDPEIAVAALGTAEGLESRLVPGAGYVLHVIPKVPLPRRPTVDLLRLPGRLGRAVAAAGDAIDATGAEVVVGFGGYAATPAYLAARRAGIPLVVHEQNARPGVANRLGARLTPWVGTTFAVSRLPHARRVGMPLRREITTLDRGAAQPEALTRFGLRDGYPTVLVFGGSLGAQRLNDAFAARADSLRDKGIQVLHVTGRGKTFDVTPRPEGPAYVVLEYCDRMDLAYAVADLAVARSGAGTVCELTALGVPGVYVPLPVGNGEQRLNAADVVAVGGGVVVADRELTPAWIDDHLVSLVGDRARLAAMSTAAASVGDRAGDEHLADLVEEAWRAGRRHG